MSDGPAELKKDLERQIANVARQAAHNAIDADAALAALERRVDAPEARVAALEAKP